MAKIWDIDKDKNDFLGALQKAIQSVNLNFLIGSGCSWPAIPPLGNIEIEVQKKIDDKKFAEAEKLIFDFLKPFLVACEKLNSPDADTLKTLEIYTSFLANISEILFLRKSNILPKQATIFSANYDLFVEKSFENIQGVAKLNDGFNRSPLLTNSFIFSPTEFFNSIYNNGNLYSYQVQVPTINLIKIHGSLSWQAQTNQICFSVSHLKDALLKHESITSAPTDAEIEKFNEDFSVVLPRKEKFKECILNQTFYDLLRVYANELDKENTLLVVIGFSFADEHILTITLRALRNPTLKVIIFCFQKSELDSFKKIFSAFNNVEIVYSESDKIPFEKSNSILKEVLPIIYKPKTATPVT